MINISRRKFLSSTSKAAGAASLALPFLSQSCQSVPRRPNILLIMADDMGYSDLGCYGSEISTPNLDRLAKGGMRFTQFYNAARCCPTRASLLTGVYPHQAGMGGMVSHSIDARPEGPYQGYLNKQCVTIGEVLKSAGYKTVMSGKWHVGEFRPAWPVDRGFDRYWGLISGAANYFDVTRAKAKGRVRVMAEDDQPCPLPTENFYMTDAITDHAIRMLKEYDSAQPFFQYVAYTAPHWPLHALPEDIEKYRGTYLEGWDALREKRFKRMKTMGILPENTQLSPRDEGAMAWEDVADKALMDLKMAVYAAQVDRMDQGIGKILEVLESQNRLDNTLILFLSDNGACAETGPLGRDFWNNNAEPGGPDSYQSYGRSWSNASNTPFRLHKQWVHEGGISTPLIAHWPGKIAAGKITHQPGHIMDIMATCVDVAGTEYPTQYQDHEITPLQGKSLTPIFKGKERDPHPYLFWEHEHNKAVRQGKWKLVAEENGPWELYDLENDRCECENLIDAHPDVAAALMEKYDKWVEEVGVRV